MSIRNAMSRELLERLIAHGEGAPSLDEKVALLRAVRSTMSDAIERVDRFLLEHHSQLHAGLAEAEQNQAKLRTLIDKCLAPPWHPARFLRLIQLPDGQRAMVWHGRATRLVSIADEVDPSSLRRGDDVLLSAEQNLLVATAPDLTRPSGETAEFDRHGPQGTLIVKVHDDEFVAEPAANLASEGLTSGDRVRWDSGSMLVYERLPRDNFARRFTLETPSTERKDFGGQKRVVDSVLASLTVRLLAPMRAAAYGIDDQQAVLLVGPPGVGKTLIARLAVAELSRLSGRQFRFAAVKPGQWESPYVGETQRNIRETFAAFDGQPGVLFLDELDSVARIRGAIAAHHTDKFLGTLLAEWDGFMSRRDVIIIGATNLHEQLDPAVKSRCSSIVEVARPDADDTRQIFEIHLPETCPFSPNGSRARHTRESVISTAVERLFAPGEESAVSTIQFRSGKTRTVHARELVSGREIKHITESVRRRALMREIHEQGAPGVTVADMDAAVGETLVRFANTLTRGNVYSYLANMPQDLDATSVVPRVRRVERPLEFVNVESDIQ